MLSTVLHRNQWKHGTYTQELKGNWGTGWRNPSKPGSWSFCPKLSAAAPRVWAVEWGALQWPWVSIYLTDLHRVSACMLSCFSREREVKTRDGIYQFGILSPGHVCLCPTHSPPDPCAHGSEVGTLHPPYSPPYFLRRAFSLNEEFDDSASMAGQQGIGICLFLHFQCWLYTRKSQ